ncbi:MAG TPA: hypothetical protein PKW49_05140 [Paludibacteraceae bacterium]|nr:hypothetical protein [Paludibacteraceae bacterium]
MQQTNLKELMKRNECVIYRAGAHNGFLIFIIKFAHSMVVQRVWTDKEMNIVTFSSTGNLRLFS